MFDYLLLLIKVNIIFLLVVAVNTGYCQDMYYDILDPPQPLPPELERILSNKTTEELFMEECMIDYTECVSTTIQSYSTKNEEMICSYNDKNEKKTFHSHCELIYQNCKNVKVKNAPWNYLHDGKCLQIT